MEFVIPAPLPIGLSIQGSELHFPVRRVYCVGQNYADHAREMGSDPSRQLPFFFGKPAQAVHQSGRFPYPTQSEDVQFELELVVALASGGADLSVDCARQAIYGYAVGLDMTRRDLQAQAKKSGRPWDVGKAFDFSAPCSAVVPAAQVGTLERGSVVLEVNGEVRQRGDLDQMIWNVPEILSHLSRWFRLEPGDLIFTGTPAGVGPVQVGDRLHGRIEGVGELQVEVV